MAGLTHQYLKVAALNEYYCLQIKRPPKVLPVGGLHIDARLRA